MSFILILRKFVNQSNSWQYLHVLKRSILRDLYLGYDKTDRIKIKHQDRRDQTLTTKIVMNCHDNELSRIHYQPNKGL